MSYNIPTNFTHLVEGLQLRANIFTPAGASNAFVNTGATNPSFSVLQGSIGAGSVITNVILCSPSGGFSGAVTYTVSISGASAAFTGGVAQFQGASLWNPLPYLCSTSLAQDSFFVVSATGGGTTQATPNIMVQYLD